MIYQFNIYVRVNDRLGTAKCHQYFLLIFPLTYPLAPYLSLVPSSTVPPAPASGVWLWCVITIVLFLQVTACTFTLPTSIILINNCSPRPSALGTVHGLGQFVSAALRTIRHTVSGIWCGYGLDMGVVGLAWWLTVGVSVLGYIISFIYEGSGHEIFLPGKEADEIIDDRE